MAVVKIGDAGNSYKASIQAKRDEHSFISLSISRLRETSVNGSGRKRGNGDYVNANMDIRTESQLVIELFDILSLSKQAELLPKLCENLHAKVLFDQIRRPRKYSDA